MAPFLFRSEPRWMAIGHGGEHAVGTAIFLTHSHFSGHASPDELRLTEELLGVLPRIDVRVADHLILGGVFFSFAREAMLV